MTRRASPTSSIGRSASTLARSSNPKRAGSVRLARMDDVEPFRDDVWIDAVALCETFLNHDIRGSLAIQAVYPEIRPLFAALCAVVIELFGKADREELTRLLAAMRERGQQLPPLPPELDGL